MFNNEPFIYEKYLVAHHFQSAAKIQIDGNSYKYFKIIANDLLNGQIILILRLKTLSGNLLIEYQIKHSNMLLDHTFSEFKIATFIPKCALTHFNRILLYLNPIQNISGKKGSKSKCINSLFDKNTLWICL